MRIIALGDIHGNLPALEACLEQAEKEGYDWIVHTGDVAGYGPFVNECAAMLHVRNIPGPRGNFDENVGWDEDDSGAHDGDAAERALAEASFRWTKRHVDLWSRRWLSDLPFEVRHEQDGRRIAVFHANPIDLYASLLPETPEPRFLEYAEAADADVIILGHAHRPFHRQVEERHIVNPGSVGRPRDGDPRTGYAAIQLDGDVRVTFRRFAYDAERTAQAMRDRGLPPDLADRLTRGI